MELTGNTVFITGASSGIGRSCALKFAELGARVLISARRKGRLEEVANEIRARWKKEVYAFELDVRDEKKVDEAIHRLPAAWSAIDILVNNAGLSRGFDKIQEGKVEDWDEMVDTNVKGLLYVTHSVVPGMIKRNKGTIINIGSIAGDEAYPRGNVYAATKAAVDSLTRGMRMDLVDTPIRVCSVDPGLVQTEFSEVRFRGNAERARKVYEGITPLSPDDIADAVAFCATRPPHVQIGRMTMYPTSQASTTLVDRKT